MTTTTTEPAKNVICTECRHDNEAERIYCHNCGERLDRSVVLAKKKGTDPGEEHRRLQKMMEGPSKLRQNFFAVAKVALGAAGAAALVLIATPAEVPAPTKVIPPQMDLDLESAASFQKPGPLEYSQEQVNAYLAYRLTSKKKALSKPFLDFVRASASFHDSACTIAMERSFFGYSIFTRSSFRLNTGSGKTAVQNVGGWIGQLPVHPAIMQYGNIIFADLWNALDREHKLIAKMAAVNFHDAGVTITPPSR